MHRLNSQHFQSDFHGIIIEGPTHTGIRPRRFDPPGKTHPASTGRTPMRAEPRLGTVFRERFVGACSTVLSSRSLMSHRCDGCCAWSLADRGSLQTMNRGPISHKSSGTLCAHTRLWLASKSSFLFGSRVALPPGMQIAVRQRGRGNQCGDGRQTLHAAADGAVVFIDIDIDIQHYAGTRRGFDPSQTLAVVGHELANPCDAASEEF